MKCLVLLILVVAMIARSEIIPMKIRAIAPEKMSLQIEFHGTCEEFRDRVLSSITISKYDTCLPLTLSPPANPEVNDLHAHYFCTQRSKGISLHNFVEIFEHIEDDTADFIVALQPTAAIRVPTKGVTLSRRPDCAVTLDYCKKDNGLVKSCSTNQVSLSKKGWALNEDRIYITSNQKVTNDCKNNIICCPYINLSIWGGICPHTGRTSLFEAPKKHHEVEHKEIPQSRGEDRKDGEKEQKKEAPGREPAVKAEEKEAPGRKPEVKAEEKEAPGRKPEVKAEEKEAPGRKPVEKAEEERGIATLQIEHGDYGKKHEEHPKKHKGGNHEHNKKPKPQSKPHYQEQEQYRQEQEQEEEHPKKHKGGQHKHNKKPQQHGNGKMHQVEYDGYTYTEIHNTEEGYEEVRPNQYNSGRPRPQHQEQEEYNQEEQEEEHPKKQKGSNHKHNKKPQHKQLSEEEEEYRREHDTEEEFPKKKGSSKPKKQQQEEQQEEEHPKKHKGSNHKHTKKPQHKQLSEEEEEYRREHDTEEEFPKKKGSSKPKKQEQEEQEQDEEFPKKGNSKPTDDLQPFDENKK